MSTQGGATSDLPMQALPSFGGISTLCADTNRPVNKIKDIYSSFSTPEDRYVVKQAISNDGGASDL